MRATNSLALAAMLTPANRADNEEAPALIEGPVRDLPPSGRIASKLFTLEFLRVPYDGAATEATMPSAWPIGSEKITRPLDSS